MIPYYLKKILYLKININKISNKMVEVMRDNDRFCIENLVWYDREY